MKKTQVNSPHHLAPHESLSQGLDWGWFWGQISWQGNFVAATCSAADCPWAGVIFLVYQKMLIACFYE